MNAISENATGAAPCPFCGSTDVYCEGDAPEGLWAVFCGNDDCGATGPAGNATPEEAVRRWNKTHLITAEWLRRHI